MRSNFSILALLLLISFSNHSILACTCVSDSLNKRLKKASAVFIGKVPDEEPENNLLIQRFSASNNSKQVLEVVKSWKGVEKEFIAIGFDSANLSISCPILYNFKEDQEYLVFAYGKEFKVNMVCSDTLPIQPEYNSSTQREVRKLSSFSYRFWSRLNPFR